MFQGILFYFASGKALFPGQQIIDGIIDPVKMSFGIRALLRITFGTFLKTDLLFRCQNNTFESQSLLPQQRKSVLRHRTGDGLGCQIEQLVSHVLPHRLHRRKYGGYGLAHSGRRFQEQFSLMINGLVHITDQFLLSVPIIKGELQSGNGLLSKLSPLPGIIRPFTVITNQLLKPCLQLREFIIFIKITDIFRLYITISQTYTDIRQLLLQTVHIGIALCLRNVQG